MKTRPSLPRGRTWLLGAAAGVAGTLAMVEGGVLGIGLYVAMLIMFLPLRTTTPFGAASFTTGLLFLYAWATSLSRCGAINSHGGSCEIYDPWIGGAIATAFAVVGLALTAYGARRS